MNLLASKTFHREHPFERPDSVEHFGPEPLTPTERKQAERYKSQALLGIVKLHQLYEPLGRCIDTDESDMIDLCNLEEVARCVSDAIIDAEALLNRERPR